MSASESEVLVFGREMCVDTTLARSVLEARAIPYRYIDVGADDAQRAHAQQLADGRTNIPVVVLTDGAVLVEPTDQELIAALH